LIGRDEFEKAKYEQENRFLNKSFGVIITPIISVSAVSVSMSQAYIAWKSSIETIKNEREKSERSYSFDIAKFLMLRRDDINTGDIHKLRYIRQVVISSFRLQS
jgi:hypothetical protein